METNKIYLNSLLNINDLNNVKIKFNQYDGDGDPRDIYIMSPDTINNEWLFWRTQKRYFNIGQIAICLLKLGENIWLLTTIKRVTKELNIMGGINYEGEELNEYAPLYGRAIIKFKKSFQSQCRYADGIIDELEVLQILPSTYDGDDFPGYDKVRLTYDQLYSIINRHKKDWIAALENQKAVYLIKDRHNGKLYVGSATGDNGMLLQRWSDYVSNGHGGNVELLEIVNTYGFEYIKKYFQYSILENYNSKIDKHIVLGREAWWKETLGSKIPFGYNKN